MDSKCRDCGVALSAAPKYCAVTARRHRPGARVAPHTDAKAKRQRCGVTSCEFTANDGCRGMCSKCYESAAASGERLPEERTEEWLRRLFAAVPPEELAEGARNIDANPDQVATVLDQLRRQNSGIAVPGQPGGDTCDCPICFDTCEVHDMIELSRLALGCGCRFCRGCAAESVDTALAGQQELKCPVCGKAVPELLMAYLAKDRGERAAQQRQEAQVKLAGCVKCPRCSRLSALPETTQAGVECPVPECGCAFCPKCDEAPHLGYTCNQVRDASRMWLLWQAQGQRQWLEQEAADQRAQEEQRQQEEEAQRRYEELQANERAMIGKCKLCTACGRRIVWVDGCDWVRCGDPDHPHGTGPVNPNLGCGARLRWSHCPAYVPQDDAAAHRRLQEAIAQRKAKKEPVKHGVDCNGCGAEIAGPRFKCLSCVWTNLCVTCVQQQRGHELKGGAQLEHVFQILHDRED